MVLGIRYPRCRRCTKVYHLLEKLSYSTQWLFGLSPESNIRKILGSHPFHSYLVPYHITDWSWSSTNMDHKEPLVDNQIFLVLKLSKPVVTVVFDIISFVARYSPNISDYWKTSIQYVNVRPGLFETMIMFLLVG